MADFFTSLGQHTFLQMAVLAALLSSVACGVVGTFVVARRITYLAGGIAHATLGGMGLARYLHSVHGWELLTPLHGAVSAALAAALVIGFVTLRAREREDTVIGAIWAIGMAVGLVFIAMTPGYSQELMSYLFGNILMVTVSDIWLILALDVVVIALVVAFHNQFNAVCFDAEFARVRGINVEFYYLLLLVLAALTVVVLVTVVGIVLVIALLTLPVAASGMLSRSIWRIMALSIATCLLVTESGIAASYILDLPAGATIILVAALFYAIALVISRIIRPSGKGRLFLR